MEPAVRSFLERIPSSLEGLEPEGLSVLFNDLIYLEAVYAPRLPTALAEQAQAKLQEVRETAAKARAGRIEETVAGATASLGLAGRPPAQDIVSGAYAKRLGRDTKDVFLSPFRWSGGDWGKAATVAVGAGALFLADRGVQDFFQEHRHPALGGTLSKAEPFGRLTWGLGVVGASYTAGRLFKHEPSLKFAGDALEGLLLSQAVVHGTKVAIGRSRPWKGKGHAHFDPPGLASSMPSGHTAQAFAIATAIAGNTQRRWVEFAAYGAAGLVGLHRIHDSKHWLSDVALGAVIGHVVTRWAMDRNNPAKLRKVEVTMGADPVQGGIAGGVRLNLDRR